MSKNAARNQYRSAIHKNKTIFQNTVSSKLQNDLLAVNPKKFWRCWKGYFKSAKNKPANINVNGFTEGKAISN